MLSVALEASTSPSEQLCMDSHTFAQIYAEWRLDEPTGSLEAIYEAGLKLPEHIARSIMHTGQHLPEERLYTFPEDIYSHCVRMWDESRKFIITF